VVIGGGHVGREVVLNDDREEFCSPAQVPGADQYIHYKLADLPEKYKISPAAALVMATRNHQVDISGLPELLAIPTVYLGVISSKRRWKLTEEQLLKSSVKKHSENRVHAPIGLNLGAETSREIALSIMAEIMLTKSGREEKTDL
jgi:xanthine dehydrogenase accessory factor